MTNTPEHTDTEAVNDDDRDVAQFFFEVGFGACFAEAMIRNGMKPPFEFSDAFVEAAWPRSIEAHDDPEEMDRYLALALEASTPKAERDGVLEDAREHVMPGDPPNIMQIALQWYLNFNFGYPHSTRESNIAVEGFKDGYRAALQSTPSDAVPDREAMALALLNDARADHSLLPLAWDQYTRSEQETYLRRADAILALRATPSPSGEVERLREVAQAVVNAYDEAEDEGGNYLWTKFEGLVDLELRTALNTGNLSDEGVR